MLGNIIKVTILSFFICLNAALPRTTYAAITPGETTGGGCSVASVAVLNDLTCVFNTVVSNLLLIGAIISFVMIVMGAFKYITAAGDPKALAGAQSTLTYAIGGMIVTAGAFVFLLLIRYVTGNETILNFRIYQ
jgi:hypothetical protein